METTINFFVFNLNVPLSNKGNCRVRREKFEGEIFPATTKRAIFNNGTGIYCSGNIALPPDYNEFQVSVIRTGVEHLYLYAHENNQKLYNITLHSLLELHVEALRKYQFALQQ